MPAYGLPGTIVIRRQLHDLHACCSFWALGQAVSERLEGISMANEDTLVDSRLREGAVAAGDLGKGAKSLAVVDVVDDCDKELVGEIAKVGHVCFVSCTIEMFQFVMQFKTIQGKGD